MLLDEYTLENTKIKFYDDYIVENVATQKEYIDNIIINLIRKATSPNVQIASQPHESRKLNLVASEKSNDFSYTINKSFLS